MVMKSGKVTIPKSAPGEFPVLVVNVPGVTVNGKAIITLAERDGITDTRGQMDFYALCTPDTITIRGEDEQLFADTDLYYIVDTDGTGMASSGIALTHIAQQAQVTNLLWVDNKRIDSYTPDGTISRPFLKIQDAVDAIISSGAHNRYQINIAPGEYYSDPITVDESHVSFVGGGMESTRISGAITIAQTVNNGDIMFNNLKISGGLTCTRNHYILSIINCVTQGTAWSLITAASADDEWLQIYGGVWYADVTTSDVYVYHHHGQVFTTWSVTNKEANFNSCDLNNPFSLTLVGTCTASAYGNRTGGTSFTVGAGCSLYIDAGTEGGSTISGAGDIYRTTKTAYVASSAPANPAVGQLWADSTGGPGSFVLKVWSGTAWETV
jgi:hypothetical protein